MHRKLLTSCLWTFAIAMAGSVNLPAQTLDFQTIVQWTNGLSPHYTCGAPGEDACFTGCANSSNIKVYSDPFTGWLHCDIPPSSCTNLPGIFFGKSGGQDAPNPSYIPFLVMTDVHLRNGHGITDEQHAFHPRYMNLIGINGWKWNVSNAGFPSDWMEKPIAVVSTGDETNDGQQTSLGAFRLLYETGRTTDSLQFPLFGGYGNHDVYEDCEFNNCAKRMLDYSGNSAACVPNGPDAESKNYSWDWGKFHMIQLNNWAGDTQAGTNNSTTPNTVDTHKSGLPWLINDLANHTGGGTAPIVIFQHYGWDDFSSGSWSDADKQSFLAAIRDYNVIAIFTGHDHNLASYSAPYTDSHGKVKILDDFAGGTGGQGGYGEFFAVRLSANFMDVMPIEWADNSVHPGINSPYPRNAGNGGDRPSFFNNVQGCRKWIGPALHTTAISTTTGSNTVTITNHTADTIAGPFAVQYKTLSSPITAQAEQVLFSENCNIGPLYVLGKKSTLAPGESETISLSNSASTPTGVVSLAPDALVASPNPFVFSGSETIRVTSSYGASVPFTVAGVPSWMKLTQSSGTTPTNLIMSFAAGAAAPYTAGAITIIPSLPSYGPIVVPISVANLPVQFTSTFNETITVDGATVQTPATLQMAPGSSHTVSAQTYNSSPGVQDRFVGQSVTFKVAAGDIIDMKFQRFVQLTVAPSPLSAGAVTYNPTSPDGYWPISSNVTITAIPNSGYVFETFENQANGQNPVQITLKGQTLFGAKFQPSGSYSISTSLGAAGSVTIDNVVHQGPQTVQWVSGSQHQLSVPSVVASGTGVQYVFQQWSDGVKLASRQATADGAPSKVAQYQQQFLVGIAASPAVGGTVTGGGWYDAGTSAILTATAANGFVFGGFSGTVSEPSSTLTIAMTQPDTEVANFTPLTPNLVASAGAHSNGPNSTQVAIVVTNTGKGAALNTFLDSVTATVQSGTGTVSSFSNMLPVTILPGQSVTLTYFFTWPATAARVAFTVGFNANSGAYQSKSTFYVVR